MAILPNSDALKDEYGFKTTEYRIFICLHLFLILLFTGLFLLLAVNFWQVIVKQQRYKNATLLTFYVFSAFTILLKEIIAVSSFTENLLLFSLGALQPVAKLHVGLVQCWIIFELTIHLRQAIIRDKDPMANFFWTEKAICYARSFVLASLSISLTCLSTYFVYRGAQGLRPFDKNALFVDIIGYLFLLLFILMLSLNLALFYQIRVKNKMAETVDTDDFRREKFQLILILTCFELSYGLRFIWDSIVGPYLLDKDEDNGDYFNWFVGFDFVAIFDGLSFLALVALHRRNFGIRTINEQADNNSLFQDSDDPNHESILVLNNPNESGTLANKSRLTAHANKYSDLYLLSVSILDSKFDDGHENDKEQRTLKGRVQSAAIQASENPSENSILASQDHNQLSHSAQQHVTTTTMSDYGLDSDRSTLGCVPTYQL